MRHLKQKWQKQWYGILVHSRFLQNLRFADDIILFGSTRAQVKHMIEDLHTEGLKFGLKLHSGKTRILSNVIARRRVLAQSSVEIHGPSAGQGSRLSGWDELSRGMLVPR